MLYYKTIWNHTNDFDTIIMCSEIDAGDDETLHGSHHGVFF